MKYETWRATFQSSEQAARAAYLGWQIALAKSPDHWAAENPGLADQFRCEARAARDELGFDKDSYDVSPSDLRKAIKQARDGGDA